VNDFKAKTISFSFKEGVYTFTLADDNGEHLVACGVDKWTVNEKFMTQSLFPLPGRPIVPTPLAASASWVDNNTLVMTWRFIATAHSDTITFKFEHNLVTISFLNSVSKGNPDNVEKRLPVKGQMA